MKRETSKDPVRRELKAICGKLVQIRKELKLLNGFVTKIPGTLRSPRKVNSTSKIAWNKEARALTIKLYRQGYSYEEIAEQLHKQLNFSTSRSAVARFVRAVTLGRLAGRDFWK